MGVAALAVSAGGAVSAADADLVGQVTSQTGAMAAAGSTGLANVAPVGHRDAIVSRDSRRDAPPTPPTKSWSPRPRPRPSEQHAALKDFAKAAEKQSAKIKENQWILPLESYRITATFGLSSYLWSSVHTGLDFSAPTGSTIRSVANGVVTETGYDGSYGNKTVVTLDDGTELWYCHQTSFPSASATPSAAATPSAPSAPPATPPARTSTSRSAPAPATRSTPSPRSRARRQP